MSAYKSFKTDEKAVSEGVWLDYGDFRVRVRPADATNESFVKAMERLARPLRGRMKANLITPEENRSLMIQVYSEAVITDWERREGEKYVRGMTDEHDKPVAFSKENVVKTLSDLPKLYADIVEQADNAALFRAELEADAGN